MMTLKHELLVMLAGMAVATTSVAADPDNARAAWAALLRLAPVALPANTGCAGDYAQKGVARLADLLAVQLAYMQAGSNSAAGTCEGSRCHVELNRSAGEDVSSMRIEFTLDQGRALPASLRCVITP